MCSNPTLNMGQDWYEVGGGYMVLLENKNYLDSNTF